MRRKKNKEDDSAEIYAQLESERMQARRKLRRKHFASALVAVLMLVILGLLAYTGARGVVLETQKAAETQQEMHLVKAEIVDETGSNNVSSRIRSYIAQLEQDIADLGYTVTKVILPVNTSRELYVDIDGLSTYFKVNMDRGTAVSAEDIARMINFLQTNQLSPSYVDVRVEGRAYYK